VALMVDHLIQTIFRSKIHLLEQCLWNRKVPQTLHFSFDDILLIRS